MENYTLGVNYSIYLSQVGSMSYPTGKWKLLDNNKNNMKEENVKAFEVVFEKTTVQKVTYNILATDEKDALDRIEKNGYAGNSETVSVVIKVKSNEVVK